jgi:hypothetical protein
VRDPFGVKGKVMVAANYDDHIEGATEKAEIVEAELEEAKKKLRS